MTFSSMYIAATGMIALGTGMQTISNNLANLETNGFKTMRTNYSDLISKTFHSSAPWPQQVGRGGQVQSIQSMFTQGAFRVTESPFDLALAGDGFFAVRSRISYHLPDSEQIMYTRAGAFTMDKNGYMEDPSGNILQGWALSLPRPGENPVRLGSPVDVQITIWDIPAQPTTIVKQAVNLSADAQPAYHYPAYGLAERYAGEQAEAAGQAARVEAERAVWDPDIHNPITRNLEGSIWVINPSNKDEFNRFFIDRYKEIFDSPTPNTISDLGIVNPPPYPDRARGQMTTYEFDLLVTLAQADMNNSVAMAGRAEYTKVYKEVYNTVVPESWMPETDAQAARERAERGVWNPAVDTPVTMNSDIIIQSNKDAFNRFFVDRYKEMFDSPISNISDLSIVNPPPEPDRSLGEMIPAEFYILAALAQADMNNLAAESGLAAYAAVYNTAEPGPWMLEINGFAGAWDGSRKPPIDRSAYNHAEHQTVYDASGRAHLLTTYYQKNPHEQNVWDYFVACEPDEDGRLDGTGRPVAGTPLAGLLQKGKITFDANGNIKDLEAQDLNPGASRAAYVDPPVAGTGALSNITIGGYYTGPGQINPTTGALVSAPRTYDIRLSANTAMNPPIHGFTWTWNDGLNSGSGFVPVDTKYVLLGHETPPELVWVSSGLSGYVAIVKEDGTYGEPLSDSDYTTVITYPGPYTLGNDGLTLTFNLAPDKPQPFGEPGRDTVRITAHSEQPGWAADTPNADGYFDVNVTFKNAPAQSISLNMGARRAGGAWLLDEVSTTQYGGNFVTVASNQDGYPTGRFSRLYVTEDGIVTGVYSNKVELPLYQLSITRFLNPWGLEKKGDNLFAVTRHSGPGKTTAPGEGGAAMVMGGYLEQSNVDTATEIVNMIVTQRGFQANSKVVTTHDAMLSVAIELKR